MKNLKKEKTSKKVQVEVADFTGQDGDNKAGAEITSKSAVWQDPGTAKLIGGLLNRTKARIRPMVDLCLKDGFSYQEADEVLGTSGKQTVLTLEALSKEGILLKEKFRTILITPTGSVQLMPVERCPYCDSGKVSRGQLIEHFHCGFIGLEEEFTSGLKQVCPKCHREIKLIGTDYRKPGARYVCNACHEIFPSPAIKCRCLKTDEVYSLEELRRVSLYSYRLNEAYRKRLEFEFEPKKQLVDCLQHLGYTVDESVRVKGRSGATHTIDLLASVEDPITKHSVAIGILAAPNDEAEVNIDLLFSFDSKIYDAGIDSKMVIAVPGLNPEAAKFAERQGIRVYSLDELRHLTYGEDGFGETADNGKTPSRDSSVKPDLARIGPKGWLKWLLEKKGYRVKEKYKLKGRSGAEHVLDFYAQKDDGIMNHAIAACVITQDNSPGNDVNIVIKFDSAAYDAGIRDKLIISVPRLSQEARRFADYQRIKILETKELADFSRQYLDDTARAEVSR